MSHCQNCQEKFSGRYCANCGQAVTANDRLRFSTILQDFLDNVFNLHRGWFYTFGLLLLRPGKVGRSFIAGQRKRYTNPVRYLIIAVAVQAFIDYWILHPELDQQPDFFHFPFLAESINVQMAKWNHVLATQYAFIHNLSMILIFPLAFLIFFRNLKYRFTELLTVNFYYFSTGLLLTIATILLFHLPTGDKLPIPMIILVTLGYVVWSSLDFFREVPIWQRVLRLSASILFFMIVRVFLLVYLLSIFFPIL